MGAMGSGSPFGAERVLPLSAFRDDEGGFTTVAVAVSLLLSLTLVFGAASAGWVSSRASEIQRVADAAAMAGENVVASFSTIVQVLDACVLSLGLTGIVVYGAGLVASCVPALGAAGSQLCAAGGQMLEARENLAKSAASGIERLEATLPLLIVASSASCVSANSEEGSAYTGCALPFPSTSESDFSPLEEEVSDEGMEGLSEEMGEVSRRAEEARSRADDALLRGWMADCGSRPYCLRERAETLAAMTGAVNPDYPSKDGWTFGVPLLRARTYYARRLAAEAPTGQGAEEITDSACRRAFYAYALSEVREGSYVELEDESVRVDLPELPRNADQTRGTELYDGLAWPCTQEGGGRVLHSSLSCPGALGAPSGTATLEQLELGQVQECEECEMSVTELGRVASASTSIENGFEHHWQAIVEASRDYEAARAELAEVEGELKDLAEEGERSFSAALETLAVTRPKLCPPGAWGCVGVVARTGEEDVPGVLTGSFLSSASLPAGAAVSAAALAPDGSEEAGNVLSNFFDGIASGDSVLGGALDGVMGLWGDLLEGYGSAYGDIAEAGSEFLDGLDGVTGGSVGSWLRGHLKSALEGAGLDPVDLRPRKPVLTHSQNVFDKAGLGQLSSARELIEALPESGDALAYARSLGMSLVNEVGSGEFTIAELSVPGTDLSIPLTVDLSRLGGAA